MSIFIHRPSLYDCEQMLPVDLLARSERFLSELDDLRSLGYDSIGSMKKVSQVDAAIAVAKQQLALLGNPPVGRVIYCSFWNDEIWTEFHCAKIHSSLDLPAGTSVTNLRVNGATALFMAVELAQAYISNHPEEGVLLLAADKVDARFVRRKFAGGLFGDGASAVYLSSKPVAGKGLWINSAPTFFIDGKYFSLDSYEDANSDLSAASEVLQGRLVTSLLEQIDESELVTFLHQPGARFSAINDNKSLQSFTGDWSGRGYMPACGLMHVVSDFLAEDEIPEGPVLLGEASVGLQYAGLAAGTQSRSS